MKSLTNKQISSKTGLKPGTIAWYSNAGIILPDISNGNGRGSVRVYSERNLHQFKLIKKFKKAGFSIKDITHALSVWRDLKLLERHIDSIIWYKKIIFKEL